MGCSETLSLAPMKSTPPRRRGIAACAVGVLAVTVPCTIRRMLAESSAETLYSAAEPGTWAGGKQDGAAWSLLLSFMGAQEDPKGGENSGTFSPLLRSCQHGGPCLVPVTEGSGQAHGHGRTK